MRFTGYISNISDSPKSCNTSTKKMFTVAGRIYYPTPGSSVESFLRRRVFFFANQFVPK